MDKDYYKKIKMHQGRRSTMSSKVAMPSMHELFYTKGEYKFGELDLIGYEWRRIYPLSDEDQTNNSMKKENYKKTLVFKNNKSLADQTMVVMHLDCEKHYHEVDIIVLEDYLERNNEIIKKTKSMLEKELKCKLKRRTEEKDLLSDFIDKLEIESN